MRAWRSPQSLLPVGAVQPTATAGGRWARGSVSAPCIASPRADESRLRQTLTSYRAFMAGTTQYLGILGRSLEPDAGPSEHHPAAAPASLGELLHLPRPRPELLRRAKAAAKGQAAGAEKVGTVLYYACIAAALARCGSRISRCDDATLRRGFEGGS